MYQDSAEPHYDYFLVDMHARLTALLESVRLSVSSLTKALRKERCTYFWRPWLFLGDNSHMFSPDNSTKRSRQAINS